MEGYIRLVKNRARSWAIYAGPAVTLALGFGWTLDQVNVIKLLALGIIAGLAAAEVFITAQKSPKIRHSPAFIVSIIFLLALLVPFLLSNSPFAQQIYGTSGRNLGFLHYFFLTLVFLGFSTLHARVFWPKILRSIIWLGTFEAIYGCLQLIGLDIFPWNNPNNWILGTFGNPNYLSSFLAISVISVAFMAAVDRNFKTRLLLLATGLFQIVIIILSNSSQGLILVSFGLLSLMVILSYQRSKIIGWVLVALGSVLALIATFGVFQSGPLAKYLFQDSVSYRGDYWRAGIRMIRDNWIGGVGLDSYGDFYRVYRDATAANRRGLDITSNSAHNLFIDLAATGGIVLLVAYLLIVGSVVLSFFHTLKSPSTISFEYKLLTVLWLAFNLQTLISINVPALAIWGWIFSGLILAYNNEDQNARLSDKQSVSKQGGFKIISLVSCTICVTLVLPLISRDVKLNEALEQNDSARIIEAILSFPRDANQIARMAVAFEKSNLEKESILLARAAIKENANTSLAWNVILRGESVGSQEKKKAILALSRLDPFFRPS